MTEQDASDEKRVVDVEFNQQQDVILKRLREIGRYGATDAEIIRTVFQEFLRQTRL
jgi:hypothetical protein